jgi:polar amino acid transport system substrate-binding protein
MESSGIPVIAVLCTAALLMIGGCLQYPSSGAATPSPAGTIAAPATGATQGELVAFVKEAVAYAKANGKARALSEFSDRNGSFFRGELYIFAYDFNGTTIAHPVNPEKIGVNRLNETDAQGNYFIRELRDTARNGSGFVEYYYINPVHGNAVEPKLGFVMKVDDTWWLGSGIYGTYAAPSPSPTTASDGAVVAFVQEAKAYAIARGKESAVAAFNDPNGSFIRDSLYVFAYDYNGTTLAWPFQPDQIGVNRWNATDPSGFRHIRAMAAAAKSGGGWVTYETKNPFRNNTVEQKTSYVIDVNGTWFLGAGKYAGS